MTEKELLKKSGFYTSFILFFVFLFWFLFSVQISFGGYTGGPASGIDVGINSRSIAQTNWQVGSSGVYVIRLGIENVTGLGTATGYMTGTNTYYPRIEWTPTLGTLNFVGTGSYPVTLQMNGVNIPSLGSVSGKIDAVSGVGTTNTFNSPTLTGQGTITASFEVNGLVITPAEYASTNNATGELQSQIDTKLTKVSGVNTYIGSVTADGKSGTSSFSILPGSNITTTSTLTAAGHLEVTINSSGTQSYSFAEAIGSVSARQLPSIFELPGTTTTIAATSTAGRLYMPIRTVSLYTGSNTLFLAHFNNPGTVTSTDSSNYGRTITAVADAIGTTTAALGSGGMRTDGTGDKIDIADSTELNFGSGDHTIEGRIYWVASPSNANIIGQWGGAGNRAWMFWANGTNLYWDRSTDGTNNTNGVASSQSWTLGTYTAWAIERWGDSSYIYINGNQIFGTTTASFTLYDSTATVSMGGDANAIFDEIRISNFARYKGGTYTVSASEFAVDSTDYTEYSMTYVNPQTQNEVFKIITTGTVTSESSYIYCNATTTVWGLGTNTAVTGTTSGAYAGWSNRPIRVSAVDIGSSREIKDNIKTIKVKPDLLDAEGLAKQNYITSAKVAWIAANGGNYTTVVNETGTGSVTIVDTDRMESDYNNYIELEWAADINQDTYIEGVQKTHEKGFWQMYNSVIPRSWNPRNNPNAEYEGFVVEEMPPVVWGEDKQSINIMSVVAYISVVQQTLKADTIFALSTLKELITTGTVTQQKIDYVNDRLEVLNP